MAAAQKAAEAVRAERAERLALEEGKLAAEKERWEAEREERAAKE